VIQAFAPDRADDPFGIGVLPRRPRGCENLIDPQGLEPRAEGGTIGSIAIPDQPARRGIPWKILPDLLGRPCGGGIRGDAEMHDATALMMQDNEHEQETERRGRDDKEIYGYHTAYVVPKECAPTQGRGMPHRPFRDLDDARAKIESWRVEYNEVRPHRAIGDRTPLSLIRQPPEKSEALKGPEILS